MSLELIELYNSEEDVIMCMFESHLKTGQTLGGMILVDLTGKLEK